MITFYYRVFGLRIKSELELPELQESDSDVHDVVIKIGNNIDHLPNAMGEGILYETAKNDFLFKIDNVASYRVENGELITVQPYNNALKEVIRLFLFGSVFGALLHQRNIVPLHGSSILTDHGAVIFVGFSSVGKSTLAASFFEAGFDVVSDDIAAIKKSQNGNYAIYRGIPYLKLWKDVIHDLNLENKNLNKVRPQLEKYKLQTKFLSRNHSFPIYKIVILETHNEKVFKSVQLKGSMKFSSLKTHTYRFNYVEGMGCAEPLFKNLSSIANEIVLQKISRPIAPKKIIELRDFIMKEIF